MLLRYSANQNSAPLNPVFFLNTCSIQKCQKYWNIWKNADVRVPDKAIHPWWNTQLKSSDLDGGNGTLVYVVLQTRKSQL